MDRHSWFEIKRSSVVIRKTTLQYEGTVYVTALLESAGKSTGATLAINLQIWFADAIMISRIIIDRLQTIYPTGEIKWYRESFRENLVKFWHAFVLKPGGKLLFAKRNEENCKQGWNLECTSSYIIYRQISLIFIFQM